MRCEALDSSCTLDEDLECRDEEAGQAEIPTVYYLFHSHSCASPKHISKPILISTLITVTASVTFSFNPQSQLSLSSLPLLIRTLSIFSCSHSHTRIVFVFISTMRFDARMSGLMLSIFLSSQAKANQAVSLKDDQNSGMSYASPGQKEIAFAIWTDAARDFSWVISCVRVCVCLKKK